MRDIDKFAKAAMQGLLSSTKGLYVEGTTRLDVPRLTSTSYWIAELMYDEQQKRKYDGTKK